MGRVELIVDLRDVEALVEVHADESQHIEFKREPYVTEALKNELRPQKRLNLAKDVAAMANGGGGTLIIGVEESGGRAAAIRPFAGLAGVEDSVAATLSTHVYPTLGSRVEVRRFATGSDPDFGILVVRLDLPTTLPPFAVKGGNEKSLEFWIRDGKSNRPMPYAELVRRFEGDEETARRRHLDAQALSGIVQLEFELNKHRHDWPAVEALLERLEPFGAEFTYGPAVKLRVARFIADALSDVRYVLPKSTAIRAFQMLSELVPVGFGGEPPTDAELSLLSQCSDVAIDVIYEASRRMGNATIMNIAGQHLYVLLQLANRADLEPFKRELLDRIEERISWARKDGVPAGAALLEYYRDNALDRDDDAAWERLGNLRDLAFTSEDVPTDP